MSYARAISHAFVAAALALSLPTVAFAQSGDKAVAEALFQDGRDLLDAGKVAEACVKFAASQRVEPKLGTLLNLASCHETQNRTATAWAEFLEAHAQAERGHQPDRIAYAKAHIDVLEKHLSRLALVLPEATKSLERLVVTMDGVTMEPAALTTLIPIDPGPHVLVVAAHAKKPWSLTFAMADGPAEDRVEVPPLEDEVEAPSGPPLAPTPPAEHSTLRPTAGWIALGIGAVGLGVGTYAGLHAFALRSQGDRECDDRGACSQRGLDLFSDVRTNASISTVAFGIGLVAIAVGAYLLATEPSAPSRIARGARGLVRP